jgi:peptide-methionine (S)-S-oxide reductase
MKRLFINIILFSLVSTIVVSALDAEESKMTFPNPPDLNVMEEGTRTAVFAGGCFWGIEGVFERLEGVTNVISGYSGGKAETAVYSKVGSGATDHAEAVQITYDSSVISYGTLLKVFFATAHDPTQLNFQGPDLGTQYRSEIFYFDRDQKRISEKYIKGLDKAMVFPKKIVTKVSPYKAFYPAEPYHQDFMKNNPNYPYIVYWDLPKVKHLEDNFPELLAGQ